MHWVLHAAYATYVPTKHQVTRVGVDDATWRAALRDQKELDKAQFFAEADKLRRIWE